MGNPAVVLQSHDENLHRLLHQLLPVVREEQVVVGDAVAHRVVGAHHIQQGGEERQRVSAGTTRRRQRVRLPPRVLIQALASAFKSVHLFSVEQKKVTQGLVTLLSEEGGRYMASEKQVSSNLSISVLKREKNRLTWRSDPRGDPIHVFWTRADMAGRLTCSGRGCS